jgi:hypothetical protein
MNYDWLGGLNARNGLNEADSRADWEHGVNEHMNLKTFIKWLSEKYTFPLPLEFDGECCGDTDTDRFTPTKRCYAVTTGHHAQGPPGWEERDMQNQRQAAAKRTVISESPMSFWRESVVCADREDQRADKKPTAGERVDWCLRNAAENYADVNAARMRVISEFQLHFWKVDVSIEGKPAEERAKWCVEHGKGLNPIEFQQRLGHADVPIKDSWYENYYHSVR